MGLQQTFASTEGISERCKNVPKFFHNNLDIFKNKPSFLCVSVILMVTENVSTSHVA